MERPGLQATPEFDPGLEYFGSRLMFVRLQTGVDVDHMLARMSRVDYLILADDYEAIESGRCVPRRPQAFLDAVAASLRLHPAEVRTLAFYLGYLLIAGEFGDDTARWFFFWFGN